MNRRVLAWGVLLTAAALWVFGIHASNAEATRPGRYRTVQISVTQYIWELVRNTDGKVICQVIVDHPNRPTNAEALQICGDQIFPAESLPTPYGQTATPAPTATGLAGVNNATPQPTAAPEADTPPTETPFDLAGFFNSVAWRFIAAQTVDREVQEALPEIITNLTVPPNQGLKPFQVILAAYEPIYGQRITGIQGRLNGLPFACAGARCRVPVSYDATLEFWAASSVGDESPHLQATLRVVNRAGVSALEVGEVTPVDYFKDACAEIWSSALNELPAWAQMPAAPDDLHTAKPYQMLAGRLIFTGQVDVKDCASGPYAANGGPNACGLEKSATAVQDWQNQYDAAIWEAGRSVGVPPRLIKTLIEQESQFWPANGQRSQYEYGLGQISLGGADVALRWDNDLFASVCNGLILDCSQVYARLPAWHQATLRGGLMRTLDAECATCAAGFDMPRVYDSIPMLARTLRAGCYQTRYLVSQRAGQTTAQTPYPDLWKFNLVVYHSGYQCLAQALEITRYNRQPVDWEHVAPNLRGCQGARAYVDNFWNSLEEAGRYRLAIGQGPAPAVFSVPPTPALPVSPTPPAPTQAAPTPDLNLSAARLRVEVYMDANHNNRPDPGEWVNGAHVQVNFPDGRIVNANTMDGQAEFDLTGRRVDEELLVALPELYRSQFVRVIRAGEVPASFRLEQPVVPPALP